MSIIREVYKIINTKNSMVYIGSTNQRLDRPHISASKTRFIAHIWDCNNKKKLNPFLLFMKKIGPENFSVVTINQFKCDKKAIRIQEQLEIWKIPKEFRLNTLRSYTHNTELTRDIEKKRKTRRDFYKRHKEDTKWVEKERERNKLAMRERRKERIDCPKCNRNVCKYNLKIHQKGKWCK